MINNRDVIPLPFATPDGDITVFISDWYTKSHKVSIKSLLVSHCLLDSSYNDRLYTPFGNRNLGKT